MPKANRGPYISDTVNEHGCWEIRWTRDGRSKRRSTGTPDIRLANRVLARHILEEDAPKARQWAAEDVLALYTKEVAPRMANPAVHISCQGHLLTGFSGTYVADITTEQVQQYIADRAAGLITWVDAKGKVRGGERAGDGAVRRELGVLVTACNYLVKTKRMPPAQVPYVPLPASPPARDRWLTHEEADRLLAACQPDPQAPLTRVYRYAAMMLHTASRKQPVFTLPWSRIDLKRKLVDFQDPTRARTKKRRGIVPMSDELSRAVLRAQREARTAYWLDRPTEPQDDFYAACKAAGLEGVSPHVLRHTWATWAAQDGVPIYAIAGVLHDTIKTVEANYLTHCPEHLRSAVNRTPVEQAGAGA